MKAKNEKIHDRVVKVPENDEKQTKHDFTCLLAVALLILPALCKLHF